MVEKDVCLLKPHTFLLYLQAVDPCEISKGSPFARNAKKYSILFERNERFKLKNLCLRIALSQVQEVLTCQVVEEVFDEVPYNGIKSNQCSGGG